jgi:hypothetical protein
MLRSSGFSIVARPEEEVLIARRAEPDAESDDGARP